MGTHPIFESDFDCLTDMRVAIITGANKGIGKETCRILANSGKFSTVYLTSRNKELGQQAIKELRKTMSNDVLKYHQLDISDTDSIEKFRTFVESEHNGFDVLVQNAGFAYKNASTESFDVQAKETLKINFWGSLNMMKRFYPIIKENGRIVNVSSMISQSTQFGLTPKFGHPLSSVNLNLTEEQLEEYANKFVSDCEKSVKDKVALDGWPRTAYGVSKLLVNGITRIYSKKAREDEQGVLINCCCPGYVKTDMSSHSANATKNTEQGAETSVWLALLPPGLSGPQGTYLADA